MIPKIDMSMLEITDSYEEVIDLFRETMYTRIPVYEGDPDNVVGIINIKDLIVKKFDETFDIKNVMSNLEKSIYYECHRLEDEKQRLLMQIEKLNEQIKTKEKMAETETLPHCSQAVHKQHHVNAFLFVCYHLRQS